MEPTVSYYFGCWTQAGHYLHAPGGRTMSFEKIGPFDASGLAADLPFPFSDATRAKIVRESVTLAVGIDAAVEVLELFDAERLDKTEPV